MRTAVSAMSTVGTARTHSFVFISARNEWFHGPVVIASAGVKSVTICQVIVIRFFFAPSFVATRMTGPGSNSMNAFSSGSSVKLMFFRTPFAAGFSPIVGS